MMNEHVPSLGRRFKEIATRPPIEPGREVELVARVQSGDVPARDELVEANLGFVVRLAKAWTAACRRRRTR
jgi:DNA-directed RNA polymerase sigma subunit (sigma70/sigma32)